jgi:hypothetical protein
MIGRHKKKTYESLKKGFPLEPRYTEMCTFSTKTFETQAIQFETWARTIFAFVPEPSGHHPRFETYTNTCPCHVDNPKFLFLRIGYQM